MDIKLQDAIIEEKNLDKWDMKTINLQQIEDNYHLRPSARNKTHPSTPRQLCPSARQATR